MTDSSLHNALRRLKFRLKDIQVYYRMQRMFSRSSRLSSALMVWQTFYRPRKIILFFPERANRASVAYRLCALLGYVINTDPCRRFDAVVKWKDATLFDPAELGKISATHQRIINGASLDISKRAVNRIFAETFGYPLEVNPREFPGEILEKSDRNATHDGRILDGPLRPEEIRAGYVYQKAIDNTSAPDGLFLEYRLPIMGGVTSFVFLKYRSAENRFGIINIQTKMEKVETAFSPLELEKITLMMEKMGLDCGELDILRDRDGRIYVVDVNNTPNGPPNGLTEAESKTAMTLLAKKFEELLEY